jgi:Domain of unknown function (DUF4138)
MLRSLLLLFAVLLLFLQLPAQVFRKASPSEKLLLSPAALQQSVNRVLALPAHFHASARASEMQLQLRNVVIDSNLLWFHLQLRNCSHIAFYPTYCRFMAKDRSKSKRKAIQSVEIMPFRQPILGVVRYHHRYDLLVPFIPFALVKPQQLIIEIGETRSRRLLSLRVPARDILHASYLP